jgi:hypothetical protein
MKAHLPLRTVCIEELIATLKRLSDLEPFVRDTDLDLDPDPDPSIFKQK